MGHRSVRQRLYRHGRFLFLQNLHSHRPWRSDADIEYLQGDIHPVPEAAPIDAWPKIQAISALGKQRPLTRMPRRRISICNEYRFRGPHWRFSNGLFCSIAALRKQLQ